MRKKNRAGFSLVEIMVALVIGVAVMIIATKFMISTQRVSREMTAKVTSAAIAARIKSSIGKLDVLRNSATLNIAGNIALRNCINVPGTCTATNYANQVPFAVAVPQPKGNRFLAGTAGGLRPVYYSVDGLGDCATEPNVCPAFRANAYFWAECGGGATSCNQAATIFVRFQVVPDDEMENRAVKAWPPTDEFNDHPERFAMPVRIRNGLVRQSQCNDNSIAKGFDNTGELDCECAPGYGQTGMLNGQPVCQPTSLLTCDDDERMTGMLANGDALCVPISRAENCRWVNFADDATRCPSGGWLRQLDMGECEVGEATKKGGGEIKCEENRGYCCVEG